MPQQPNFTNLEGAAAGSEYDNLSDAELHALINQAHQIKTGRQGRVHSTPPPPEKKHVDLDRLIKQYGG